MSWPFAVERLSSHHVRTGFACGVEALDSYFHSAVTQDVRRRLCACFVAVNNETGRIAGFYTLAMSSIVLGDIGADLRRKLPRYPLVPAVRLGPLAVDGSFAGGGLGGALLAKGIARAVNAEIAAYAMVVDAKDERAASFYRHHGFLAFESRPLQLYLPLARTAPVVPR